jgi:ferric-dicitrate binding protein FerR (iron transport regulator)
MSDALEKLLDEVREDLGTKEARSVDWDQVDERVFARIEAQAQEERRAEKARFAPQRRRGLAMAAVGLVAAAAIVAVVVGKTGEPGAEEVATSETAGTVVSFLGDPVLVDGKPAGTGATLRLGDVIETRGGQATVDRPGKLTLTLEPGTRTVVTHVNGALVLALERGAVEAQVVPVSSGEAFAVDVAGSRVAVHGTHLRVARASERDARVVVDLNEGVVAVGEAPRLGSVVGTLVNAPAHVEYDAADPAGSLKQTHDPAAVRPPARTEMVATAPPLAFRPEPPVTHPAAPAAEPRPESHPSSGMASKPSSPAADANAESAVAAAVRACMANRPSADNVTVVVSTTLHLDLFDDGSVRAARFDPPVAPDVNACAAQAIYRERFDHGGAAAIRVDFSN